MLEEIKKTDSWDKLVKNPKFEQEFKNIIGYHVHDMENVEIEHIDNSIIITYESGVRNRDLDCQLKEYNRVIFSLDEENNLVINELDGKLESNYGYGFINTNGGVFKTHYSTRVFDNDGVELSYQSYGDKYHLDEYEFNDYMNDLQRLVLGSLNPKLGNVVNVTGVYPYPPIIGKEGRFIRQIRSKDNLGIVEVVRGFYNPDATLKGLSNEYYFNTFFISPSKLNPELIHIANGFPFAKVLDNDEIVIEDDYKALGLTRDNYKDVARDRFQKELMEEKRDILTNPEALAKYELMLNRLENENKIAKRIH